MSYNNDYYQYQQKKLNAERRAKQKFVTESVADILPSFCESISLDDRIRDMAVLRLWPTLLPDERFQAVSRAIMLKRVGNQTHLLVRVSDATAASELSFYREQIRHALNDFASQTGVRVDDIRLHVGHLPEQ